ncbi:hypothetical protein [Ectobacillus sp. sgz5001026]|uniref:hypothetical protein n=1 Tax=Ectobacillus sp. sgz5001026 TaxID=3242473 RepID=UPI0036D249DC
MNQETEWLFIVKDPVIMSDLYLFYSNGRTGLYVDYGSALDVARFCYEKDGLKGLDDFKTTFLYRKEELEEAVTAVVSSSEMAMELFQRALQEQYETTFERPFLYVKEDGAIQNMFVNNGTGDSSDKTAEKLANEHEQAFREFVFTSIV